MIIMAPFHDLLSLQSLCEVLVPASLQQLPDK